MECNDWRDASPKHHCFKVCEDCYSCSVCMKCNKAPASRKKHQNSSKRRIHRRLSTHLQGTQKADRITGSSLTIARRHRSCTITVVGWFLGPALIASRMRLCFFFSPSKGIQIPECGKFFFGGIRHLDLCTFCSHFFKHFSETKALRHYSSILVAFFQEKKYSKKTKTNSKLKVRRLGKSKRC